MGKGKNSGVHDGHRERMRERIRSNGIFSLQPHEILEYLLYAFIPRKDTNGIAHELIAKFGSLSGVFNAERRYLEAIPGMTANAALFLSSLPDVLRFYANDTASDNNRVRGRNSVREMLGNMLFGAREEALYVAAMDKNDGIISMECLGSGLPDRVNVPARSIVDFALRTKAVGIVVAHNHPAGNLFPSSEDVTYTAELIRLLQDLQIELYDHFIFCNGRYYSFEEQGRIKMLKEEIRSFKEGYNYYE